jgi:anti-sigma regulatory factor (Ser/Thr protein kinase)
MGFRHEALFYEREEEYLAAATAFVHAAAAAGEPTLVMVGADRIAALRERVVAGDGVQFADMREVGANPARIIPAWREFTFAHPGRRLRGIGEPIWPERAGAELVESQRHESLLNLAFADADVWLLCPYDTVALDREVVNEARRSHPYVMAGDRSVQSAEYLGADGVAPPFEDPLPKPPARAASLPFGPGQLHDVRAFVTRNARAAGMPGERVADLVTAINELATNSLLYGGAYGSVHLWSEDDTVVCEVRDDGRIDDPLIGRRAPGPHQHGGRGLWMANQLCDLVQVRSSDAGSVVRLHLRR